MAGGEWESDGYSTFQRDPKTSLSQKVETCINYTLIGIFCSNSYSFNYDYIEILIEELWIQGLKITIFTFKFCEESTHFM